MYRLERLFNSADASGSDPDVSTPGRPGESGFASLQRQPNLKEYVESFDQVGPAGLHLHVLGGSCLQYIGCALGLGNVG